MPELITRDYTISDLDIRRTDRAGRTVTAYAAVFDQDAEIRDTHGHYIERIHRSAFNRTVSRGIDRINVFYNHGYDLSGKPNMLGAVPIATPLEIKPDGKGLLTVSRYNDGELADAILAAWEGGQIKGQSFQGTVFNHKTTGRQGNLKVIERTEIGLKEYGPTYSPTYVGAGLVAIRSQDELMSMIRSMIGELTGTPVDPPVGSAPSSTEPGAPGEPPADGPSSRNRARLNLQRAKALELGVFRGKAPQESGHRQGS